MSELLNALGIDWKLLLAQLANFVVLLVILRLTVYKPLLSAMRQRRDRIEFGLKGADEAERRLAKIEEERQEKLKQADLDALGKIRDAEQTGKKRFQELVHGAEVKADYMLKEAANIAKRREQEEMDRLMKEAQGIIKAALIKTVELNPKDVDDKLISKAINEV